MVAGSVPGRSVVDEVKAIDQALVALPTLRRRIAGSGAWHSRLSVTPGGPDSEEDALPVQLGQKSGHHLNRSAGASPFGA
jgi:hypothetical protein